MKTTSYLIALVSISLSGVHADVKLPAIFGDHMVLQQESNLPVWGWADPGENVIVTFGGAKAKAAAGTDGTWRANLPAVPAGSPPGTLVVAGKNVLTISDVLVGDVWICSGQSNMEYGITMAHNAKEALSKADNSQIRLFHLPRSPAILPQTNCKGEWVLCNSTTLSKLGGWNGFTAVGYFFGSEIQKQRKMPVGLIETAYGGTSAENWTDVAALEASPVLKHYADTYHALAAEFPGGQADFEAKMTDSAAADLKWHEMRNTDKDFHAALSAWNLEATKAKVDGKAPPPQPTYSVPQPPQKNFTSPITLFNGMINPLIPFAIKGAIWYQGEANAGRAMEYRTLLPVMISSWRTHWGQGDFPFLIVQLPNCGPLQTDAAEDSSWSQFRESQTNALTLRNTGIVTTIDIGTVGIHPYDKLDVGLRLALVARHIAYGENLVWTGPIYDSMKAEANKIRIAFKEDSLGGGLFIGSSPWIDPRATQTSKTDLQGFAIAGEDKKWVWADAKIDGKTVTVSSPQVANPLEVRYAWGSNPTCNLYNKEGLPATPFRTDTATPIVPK